MLEIPFSGRDANSNQLFSEPGSGRWYISTIQAESARDESLKTYRGLGGKETTQAQPWRSAGPPDRGAEPNAVQFPWGKNQQEVVQVSFRHQQRPVAL